MADRGREPVANVVLYNLRDARGETQEQVAEALNMLAKDRGSYKRITGNQISRWERGVIRPSGLNRQLLAAHFGVSVVELGLAHQKVVPVAHPARVTDVSVDAFTFEDEPPGVDEYVTQNQQEWLHVRKSMNVRHLALSRALADLYPASHRMGESGLIAPPSWVLAEPVDLAKVKLLLDPVAPSPAFDGTEDESIEVRPLASPERRYHRYSHAVRDIARPRLLENRPCWRLTEVDFSGTEKRLTLSDTNYFDAIDVCEAVAHEAAARHLVNGSEVTAASWRGLRLRTAIGDPFDPGRRTILPSINTLTIRDDGVAPSVVLHNRSAASVATSGGMMGVMPAGVFQPSTVRQTDHAADFDLWRNIMREYSEEFLGNPEHDGDGPGADYTIEPFRTLEAARNEGKIRVYCLGIGIDSLTLWAGIETVAVFDADVYDDVFANLVNANEEGTVLQIGQARPSAQIPFTEHIIEDLAGTGRLAPEAEVCLRLAWQHRRYLLGR